MQDQPSTSAFAIIPCNNSQQAHIFWGRLGFAQIGGAGEYLLMAGWDCEVHLTRAGEESWRVEANSNPFGIFTHTPHVDEIAARAEGCIIRPGVSQGVAIGASMKSESVRLMGRCSGSAGRRI